MAATLLVLNAGSATLKFALFADGSGNDAPRRLLHGLADLDPSHASLSVRDTSGAVLHHAPLAAPATHASALDAVLVWLRGQTLAAPLRAVGHRIVHGGVDFEQPALIDETVLRQLDALIPLAPLHQPHNLAAVRAARDAFAEVPQIACFDTAFHRTQPDVHQHFALPAALRESGIRRYGFHGLSCQSVLTQLARVDADAAHGRLVVAHLGGGCSMTAIADGSSLATTMSFSPLDGLPMATRCGRLDPAVVLHLIEQRGMALPR
jgi:acetate kinase